MRTSTFSRRVIDPINSAAWYAMDGLWLARWEGAAYGAAALTLATGAWLLVLGRKRGWSGLGDVVALNAWMWMNALWLVSDLADRPGLRYPALGCFGLGAAMLLVAVVASRDTRAALQHFRKLRLPEG